MAVSIIFLITDVYMRENRQNNINQYIDLHILRFFFVFCISATRLKVLGGF